MSSDSRSPQSSLNPTPAESASEPLSPIPFPPIAPLERVSGDVREGTPSCEPVRKRQNLPSGGGPTPAFTPEQRLLVLDVWKRSALPAGDFCPLVGVAAATLYEWKRRFEELGPAGLTDQPRGRKPGSRLPEATKRAILMMREAHGDWGCQRLSDMLLRGPALHASPEAVARVLRENGIELEEPASRPHTQPEHSFERATPNQLWQTDLFTFMLKRQNRRAYMVAFMDDHSRFIVSYGLHLSQSTPLVIEALRAGIANYGPPEEVFTDNGTQYVTWRGKSAFAKELERRGIRHVIASPHRPQSMGKIERWWSSLWKECLESAIFVDLQEARTRIGLFIDYYNFQRVHQSLDGLVPADRFFGAAEEVKRTLASRVAANALTLAKNGLPKEPFYMTGQAGGRAFTLHAEGERVYLTDEKGARREIDLVPPEPKPLPDLPSPVCPVGSPSGDNAVERSAPPGTSPLDSAFGIPGSDASGPAGQVRGGSLDDVMRRLKEEGRS